MESKKLSQILVYFIFFILILNFLANTFHLYYSIWWFDALMHFLGGLWVALACLYLFPLQNSSANSIFKILLLVLIVGVGWEVFEFVFYDSFASNPFNPIDTISDVFFDLSGGSCAILYVWKKLPK